MKKTFIFVALCLIFSMYVYAVTIEQSINNNIFLKEYDNSLSVDLLLIGLDKGEYNLYTLSDVYLEPSDFFSVSEDNSDLDLTLTITPMDRLYNFSGSYIVSYFLNDRDREEKYNKKIALSVLSISDIVDIESDIVNLSAKEVTINIKNNYDIEINNVNARFKSLLFDVESTFDLKPNEVYSFKIPISNDELKRIPSGSYLMDVIFVTPKGDVKSEGQIHLLEKKDIVTTERHSGFFIRKSVITVINTGNTIEDANIKITKNIINRYYTSFSDEPLTFSHEGNDIVYLWSKNLSPFETYTITSTTNNLFPFLLIAVIVLVLFGIIRYFRTKIQVEKSVTRVKTKENEFALRVNLVVKSKGNVSDVVLVDRVPSLVKIYKKGMTTPDEIDATTRRLKWNLGEMKSGEERHFNYVVYSRVNYLGRFSLPAAISRFKLRDKIIQVQSNNVFFVSEPHVKEE